VSAAKDLLNNYQHVIESLTIRGGGKGIFDVTVDDRVIFSKKELDRHAEAGEILELFTAQFARGVTRYAKE